MRASLVLLLLIASCSGLQSPPESQNKNAVYKAAYDGNVQQLQSDLADSPNISDFDRFDLLSASLIGGCNPDIFKFVFSKNGSTFKDQLSEEESITSKLSYGWTGRRTYPRSPVSRPGARLVNLASTTFCPEVLELLSMKVTSDDFAVGISTDQGQIKYSWDKAGSQYKRAYPSFTDFFLNFIDTSSVEELKKPNIGETVQFIKKELNQLCTATRSLPCKAKQAFKEMSEKAKGKITQLEYEQSKEGQTEELINIACDKYRQYKIRLALISEENEKGKISGFVNKYNLKTWGDQAYNFKIQYDALNAERKKREKTKKNVHDEYQCDS